MPISLESMRGKWAKESQEIKSPSAQARAEQTQPKIDRFSTVGLLKEIEDRRLRPESGWNDVEQAPTEQRDDFVRTYIDKMSEAKEVMLQVATREGRSQQTLLEIEALCGAEMIRVWTLRRPKDREQDFQVGIVRSVEWQNKVAAYLLEVDRTAANPARRDNELRQFWESCRRIIASAPNIAEREELARAAWLYRKGIIGAFAVGHSLRSSNHLEVQPPADPEDDALHKIDLIGIDSDKHTYLIQIKSSERDEPPVVQKVKLGQSYGDTTMYQFQRGVGDYLKKNNIHNPNDYTAVFIRISLKEVDLNNGIPSPGFRDSIGAAFSKATEKKSPPLTKKI